MSCETDSLEERVRHLEFLVLVMQAEISTLRNMVKRTTKLDDADEAFLREFSHQHQQQFRALFADLPDRGDVIRQIVADYSRRVQLELDHSEDVP